MISVASAASALSICAGATMVTLGLTSGPKGPDLPLMSVGVALVGVGFVIMSRFAGLRRDRALDRIRRRQDRGGGRP